MSRKTLIDSLEDKGFVILYAKENIISGVKHYPENNVREEKVISLELSFKLDGDSVIERHFGIANMVVSTKHKFDRPSEIISALIEVGNDLNSLKNEDKVL